MNERAQGYSLLMGASSASKSTLEPALNIIFLGFDSVALRSSVGDARFSALSSRSLSIENDDFRTG